ncbi:MAG: response regulator transcription factor [Pseudomonadales bacterium]|nr:response regulator transcription factor [Pseudomonadales bacterium]
MKILIVEDNRDIAENIAEYLEPLGYVLDFAYDGKAGLELALDTSFDAIVLDVMLPGLDGFSVCRKLRQDRGISTPVLMLTARDQLADKLSGFDAGVDDYVVKPFSVKELEARLKALVKRGAGQQEATQLEVADLHYDLNTQSANRAGIALQLNPIQRKLLVHLLRNQHRVVSRSELEQIVWEDNPPDKDILRSHIYSLRNTIDKPFDSKLLQTIHGIGYRLCSSANTNEATQTN